MQINFVTLFTAPAQFLGGMTLSSDGTYRAVAKVTKIEFEIKKSRFIGDTKQVATEAEALAFIDEIKAEYPTATHHCYAYVTDYPGRVVRMNDDGEPSGTAGRPILEVIEREELTNTVVVATRYFGGIMLGAGGLVRAYARTSTEAIAAAGIVTYVMHEKWSLRCEYSAFGRVEHYLRTNEIHFSEPTFDTSVNIILSAPASAIGSVRAAVDDMLGGAGEWSAVGRHYMPA